nr:type III-B CRISPR-associated protein Cas10/Cmr2 [Candidatus Freyarchaeota archaeon]
MNKEEFFCLKAAALLHDPPTKAWMVAGKFGTPNFNFHEEAFRIVGEALSGTSLGDVKKYLTDSKVKKSDVLADNVDKWLLGKLVGEDYGVLGVSEVKIKNIFNPLFSQDISRVPESRILSGYISSIKGMLKNVTDVGIAYHLLYACYEPLWIVNGLPVGPADTRVPTHSVFDHSYATASIINWLFNGTEKVDGILLFIDLAGIQRFISSSRKLRDLWVSSYLVSALAWYLFWIFVKPLGPDVLLIPTCRDNQFYYHSLLSELSGNVDDNVVSRVKDLAKGITGYDTDEHTFPKFAVIPATASLILPSINILKEFKEFKDENINSLGDLEEFVKRKYGEIWKKIFDSVSDFCKKKESGNGFNVFLSHLYNLLEECRKYGFDKTSPLPIRVIALNTEKFYQLRTEQDEYEIYHYMFRLLEYEQWQRKLLKGRPEESLLLFDMTSQPLKAWPKETGRGFDYCTVCGNLPAIVIMPADWKPATKEKESAAKEKDEYDKTLEEMKIEAKEIRPIFGPGERLCPYCLIKRIISIDDIRESVFSKLIGGKTSKQKWEIRFPSVADIAIATFRRTLVDKADRIKLNNKLVESIIQKTDKLLGKLESQKKKPLLKAEEKLLSEIGEFKKELREDLEVIISIDAEQTILKDRDSVSRWMNFIRTINEETKQYKPDVSPLQSYYALINCDGDNMGKIITGKIKEAFRITVNDYLCNAPEGDSKKVIEYILENRKDEAKQLLNKEGIKNAENKIEELAGFLNELKSKNEILISPSYHTSLSRALMRSAIRDSEIAEAHTGLVVYAGGDDIVAVMPVVESLEALCELRKRFSLPSSIPGFDVLESFWMPSLVSAGRSSSVYFAHYMFPLYSIVRNNSIFLEDLAKEAKWPKLGMEKDTLALTFSPRGGGITSLLPLGPSLIKMDQKRELAESAKEINSIIKQIDDEVFSTSLLYDLENNSEMLIKLIKSDPLVVEKIVEKFLEYIFERNTPKKADRVAKKWSPYVKSLKEKYNLTYFLKSDDQNKKCFINDFIKALIIYKSGVKGVAL